MGISLVDSGTIEEQCLAYDTTVDDDDDEENAECMQIIQVERKMM